MQNTLWVLISKEHGKFWVDYPAQPLNTGKRMGA